MKISAYIPAYNNSRTIGAAIASVRGQSIPVDEIFVVDDGSTDGTAEVAASAGIRVIAQPVNQGRGAARARAMVEAAHELVLCCDAAKTLDPDFVKNALPWFEESKMAAVFGWFTQLPPVNAVERWMKRHLFKAPLAEPQHHSLLATGGAIVRAAVAKEVGGYNPLLRLAEDADLGSRLLAAGYDVICDPKLRIVSASPGTLRRALERYWRWNTAPHGRMGAVAYLRQIVYSIKVMAREDLLAHDPSAALISLICPHYQFWKSLVNSGKRPA
jgi:glycosyltransferase involved in cell wall biosynthesis